MIKKIILKLKSIEYSGDSIGDDIRLEIAIRNKIYTFNKTIKINSIKKINEEIVQFEILDNLFEEEVTIKVIEKDLIFNDVGEISEKIKVDLSFKEIQEFEFKIKVQEMRKTFGKATAIFLITLSVDEAKRIPTVDDPKWTGDFNDDIEQMILARAIYGEMRGESVDLKVAVGWSIRNRVEDKKSHWGKTYHDVILQKSQYEPFSKNSNVFGLITKPPLSNPTENKAWYESYKVALDVFFGHIKDPTNGANHFYSIVKGRRAPGWSKNHKVILQINNTKFYKFY